MNGKAHSASICLVPVMMALTALTAVSCGSKQSGLLLESREVDYLNKTGDVIQASCLTTIF